MYFTGTFVEVQLNEIFDKMVTLMPFAPFDPVVESNVPLSLNFIWVSPLIILSKPESMLAPVSFPS